MEKTVVLCIGNKDGGDDAIGPFIANNLKDFESNNLIIIDAGVNPENFTGVVKEFLPEQLIIVDAIDMNLEKGEIRRVPADKISVMHVSTHGIPLSVLIKYFKQYIKKIILIGIQPCQMNGELTAICKDSGKKVINSVLSNSLDDIPILT